MALFDDPVPGDDAVVQMARLLARWQQRIAPLGSRRSRLAGRLVRLTRRPADGSARLRQRYRMWDEPRARVVVWDGAAPHGRVLPDRPRILILKLDHIGDLAVALPALRRLREAFPDASLTLVCGPWNQGLAGGLGWFDRVVPFNAYDANRRIDPPLEADRLTRFARLNLGSYDLAIDLRHEPDTRPLLLSVDAGLRAGFQAPARSGGTRLDLVVPDTQDALRLAGAEPLQAGVRLETLAAAVAATFARRRRDPAVAPAEPRYIVLAPGAGAPVKRWPLERLTALAADLVGRHGVDVVLVGSADDRAQAAALAATLPAARVRDLTAAMPLADLPALLRGASLFVGYDSGPSHIAAALGVPTVCVFAGVSDASVWHPVGPAVTVVAGLAGCSPCRLTLPETCPNGLACLTAITVETVRDACERYLSSAAARGRHPGPYGANDSGQT
jgi:ADP-heptose:LPS heptosyltransferase